MHIAYYQYALERVNLQELLERYLANSGHKLKGKAEILYGPLKEVVGQPDRIIQLIDTAIEDLIYNRKQDYAIIIIDGNDYYERYQLSIKDEAGLREMMLFKKAAA